SPSALAEHGLSTASSGTSTGLIERTVISSSTDSHATSVSDSSPQTSTTPLTVPEAPETMTLSNPTEIPPEVSHLPNTREKHLEETIQQVENGNCKIIDPLKHIFQSEGQEEADYYSFFCENIGEDLDIPNKFEGAFPKLIFKSRDWTKDKKIEMKVQTDMGDTFSASDEDEGDYPYKISLFSESFIDNSLLEGKWNYHDFEHEEISRSGAIVKFTHSDTNKDIYLLLDL
ncbi:hypothetical protein DNK47_01505, partial [Mycoplasma wenyonii]